MATVVKTVRIDLSISGDAASKQKLDAISARAEELKTAFPTYAIKIDSLAAGQKLAVFRADMKATADAAKKPMDIQILTDKAKAKLADLDAAAEKAKLRFPSFTATIDDKTFKAKLALMDAESKIVGDKIDRNLSGGRSSGFGRAISSAGGGILAGTGAAGAAGSGIMSPIGITALAAAAAAAIPVIAAVATVATGATLGLAAFAAVGMNTYQKLTSDISALHTANENFQQSALNVDTALKASALDTKIYDAALKGMPAGMAQAAKLLGDQNVRWQDLTTAQQNNVVALANNAAAVKSLLPSQKTALSALLAGKKAWDDMSPGQQAAAKSLNLVSNAWGKLTDAMSPVVLGVIAEAAGFVAKAIGPIGDIAKLAAPGIKTMVGILGTGMVGFLKQVQPLIAPSIGALNSMLVKMSPALEGLVAQMVKGMPQFVKLFGALATILTVGIEFTSWLVMMSAKIIPDVQKHFHDMAGAVDWTRIMVVRIGHDSEAVFNTISNTVVKAFKTATDSFLSFVSNMLHGLLSISTTMGHLPSVLGAPWRAMSAELRTAIGNVGGLKNAVDRLPTHKGVSVSVTGSGGGNIVFRQVFAGQPPVIGTLAFHSAGARIPGYGGGDRHPALLEGGEAVVPKHLTPQVAPFLRAHGVPGFAAGGLVGAGSVLNTGEPWMAAREGSAGYAAATAFGRGLLNSMHQMAARAAASTGAGMGGAGVARWAPLILQVLAMLRQSSANLGAVEHRMAQESGGNPRAINLTDINARMGDPSRGLMQTIGSTFARYRSFSLPNDIYNPEANIFAGLNYAVNAYAPRSLSSVMMQAGGYDSGGYLPTGLSLAYNGTGRPEPVGHGGNTYHVTVNMPFGSTRAEVENGLVKALDSLNHQRRLPRVP